MFSRRMPSSATAYQELEADDGRLIAFAVEGEGIDGEPFFHAQDVRRRYDMFTSRGHMPDTGHRQGVKQ